MVNNMCEAKPTTDWESRFKVAYEEFQAEKKRICHDYEAKIAEMKAIHAKEIESTMCNYMEQVDAMREIIENNVAAECGCVVIEGSRTSAAYQDFVGILLANNYAVEVIPMDDHRKLKVIIKESEEK